MTTRILFTTLVLVVTLGAAGVMADGRNGNIEWRNMGSLSLQAKPIMMVPSLDGKFLFVLSETSEILVYDSRENLQGAIPVEKSIRSIDLSAKGDVLYLMDDEKKAVTMMAVEMVTSIDTADSPFKGKAEAPVVVAVFSDFE